MPILQRSLPRLLLVVATAACLAQTRPETSTYDTWQAYGGTEEGSQYSALKQINRTNVKSLQQVWTFPTGDVKGYSFNPLVVGETMYVLAQNNSIIALRAASGQQMWAHPLNAKTPLVTNRGLSYWQSADGDDRRLIFAVCRMAGLAFGRVHIFAVGDDLGVVFWAWGAGIELRRFDMLREDAEHDSAG
jgi:quinoprotein glucose dehydrogenase